MQLKILLLLLLQLSIFRAIDLGQNSTSNDDEEYEEDDTAMWHIMNDALVEPVKKKLFNLNQFRQKALI